MQQKEKSPFFYQLESLRGIAAILVVSFHCVHYFSPFEHIMLFNKGYVMVDLFFVLSGFVIYNNYESKVNTFKQFRTFLLLRVGRIYPLHFFTTIIWLGAPLVEYLTGDYGLKRSTFSVINTAANFLLIHNWGFQGLYAINAPSWSISTEFFAYIFFAVFLLLFRQNFKLIVGLTLLFSGFMLLFLDIDNTFIPLSRCLFSFCLGCLISLSYKRISREQLVKVIPGSGIMVIIMLILLELIFRNYSLKEYFILPLVSAILILSLIVYPTSATVRFLEKPFFIKLGTLSYSIYMIHGIVITFFVRAFKFTGFDITLFPGSLILIICIFTATYIVSNITHKYIEKVFRDKIRDMVRGA